MTDRELGDLLNAWMDLGPSTAPPRVVDAARLEARSTRQAATQSGWLPRRFPDMTNMVRIGLVAAAVVAAALLGYSYLIAPRIGGPTLFPPDSTPEPSVAATSFTSLEGEGTDLDPGAYRIDYAAPVTVVITIPDEPFLAHPSAWYKARFDWGPWHQSNAAALGVMDVSSVSTDPCASGFGPDQAIGPGVEDLAAALGQVVGIEVERAEASLDGYSGQLLDITATERPADCVEEPVLWLTTRGDSIPLPDANPDESVRVWILDVDSRRLVILATASDDLYRDDVQRLVDSLQIEAP